MRFRKRPDPTLERREVELTDEMRGWLNERQFIRDETVRDAVEAFRREFDLLPSEAGRLIGRWICES
jgi:hypothetical protein